MTSFGSGEKMCNLQIRYHFQYNSCVKDQLVLPDRRIFIDILRGMISEERYQASYHVRKLKNGNGWLFLCDTWLRYLKKLQFMLTETRQISNLRSQDVSKEILSDLVRKNVAEFSDKFFHFQYATLEMFKGALNNYSMLKLLFNQHPPFFNVL